MVDRLYKRFLWLDAKVELYEGEEQKALKFIDQMNKTAAGLLKLLEIRGVEASGEDLSTLLSKIPGKEAKKWLKEYLEGRIRRLRALRRPGCGQRLYCVRCGVGEYA